MNDWRTIWVGLALIFLAVNSAQAIQCRVTVTALNFGTYMPISPSHADSVGQITVRCQAQPGSFTVVIGPGLSGDLTARTLTSTGPDILYYNLYRDPSRTQIWGDGTPPTFTVSGVRPSKGRPTFYNYPVYGRIFANQAPNPGVYNDSPMVTVLF
jgi:spore coat protein U-like protein